MDVQDREAKRKARGDSSHPLLACRSTQPRRHGKNWCSRCIVGVTLLPLLAAQGGAWQPIDLQAEEVEFCQLNTSPDSECVAGQTKHAGSLQWTGGLKLSSSSEMFGGWSDMRVDTTGNSFVAVSDLGYVMAANISWSGRNISRGEDDFCSSVAMLPFFCPVLIIPPRLLAPHSCCIVILIHFPSFLLSSPPCQGCR